MSKILLDVVNWSGRHLGKCRPPSESSGAGAVRLMTALSTLLPSTLSHAFKYKPPSVIDQI